MVFSIFHTQYYQILYSLFAEVFLRLIKKFKESFNQKIIALFISMLLLSSFFIGITGYFIAHKALDAKGEVILKNSAIQAVELINSKYAMVQSGALSLEAAQEEVKEVLSGKLNPDGTRTLNHLIDLGTNGYMIIYDQFGTEVMHPTLEGQNVWEVVDYKEDTHYIVQEQIKTAKSGGGFVNYQWLYPHSDKVGDKISYTLYEPNWEWTVVATAYKSDFNKQANTILKILLISIFLIGTLISIIITTYVNRITSPILKVSEGMLQVGKGHYEILPANKVADDEIGRLIYGYNGMVESLLKAEKDLASQNEKLHYLAYHDELTGLLNRYGLKEAISNRLSKVQRGYFVQLDIVGLKSINSTMGYDQGDRLLNLFGEYFSIHFNEPYYCARTGSNEFSLWIESLEMSETSHLVYNLRHELKQYLERNNFIQMIDFYLSMSLYPSQGENFDTLYEEATMAMKQAKEKKDLSINVYETNMKYAIENELLMRQYLHKALLNQEIVPYYQSKIDYTTQTVVGVEALARWTSEELGVVSPAVFIPAITQLNMMIEFTEYMFKCVLKDYTEIKAKYGDQISVSINISPSFFLNKDFYDKMSRYISDSSVPADKIILEITEDIFIADYKEVSVIIRNLHEIGFKISIDDFGTGYSSLNYLTTFDFDEIKIDKTFIDQIIEDEKVFNLFKIICNIAEIYNYDIVAEGVETNSQLDKISETSLKVIQGYLFSKPEPL